MINPFKSKKGLGRGLSSLIGDSEVNDEKSKIPIFITESCDYFYFDIFCLR